MRLSDRAEMLIPPLPWDRRAHQGSLRDPIGKVVLLHGLGRINSQPRAQVWFDPAPLQAIRADLVKLR